MDSKTLIKTAQERIIQLDAEKAELRKESAEVKAERDLALKKLAGLEREKKVDHILEVLIDEKHYFQEAQRQEKRAHLMDDSTDLDAFLKIAGELDPREPGMFYEASPSTVPGNKEEDFFGNLQRKLTNGLYGG